MGPRLPYEDESNISFNDRKTIDLRIRSGILSEANTQSESKLEEKQDDTANPKGAYKIRLVWRNILWFAYLHLAAIYGVYLIFTSAKIQTTIYGLLLGELSGVGITAGAHRLWAHSAYKATWQLKLLLIIFDTVAFQNSVYEWSRDHRAHHKFSETDADPHNAKRGFFFSHVGWLLCRKHPDVIEKGRSVNLKDLDEDPFVQFQKRHYLKMVLLFSFVLPPMIPVYCWGETWSNAWHVAVMFRYCTSLNFTFLVNSAAHLWGQRPYDKNINPAENIVVAILAVGEGWHNYHHVFPWDYKAAELGNYRLNFTTAFIDFFAKIGWAYDLKSAPPSLVDKRACRTGTRTRKTSQEEEVWRQKDGSISQKDFDRAVIWREEKR